MIPLTRFRAIQKVAAVLAATFFAVLTPRATAAQTPPPQQAAGPQRVLVDHGNVNAATDTFDGLHPNDLGDEKMAANRYTALLPYLQ